MSLLVRPIARHRHRRLPLLQAIALGRRQGVEAPIARLNLRAAEARSGQRRADLLPNISGAGSYTRQTLNLDEFGLPQATGVTDPFNVWRRAMTRGPWASCPAQPPVWPTSGC